MTAMLPAHLTETLNHLGDAAAALTDEVRADKEARAAENQLLVERQRRQNRRVLVLLVTVAVLVAALVLMAVSNRVLNNQNKRIVERIESCTTAGGECYEQSRQRVGDAAIVIVRGVVFAEICLREDPDASDEQVEACVLQRLQAGAERDEPPPSGVGPDGEPIPDATPAPTPGPSPTP
jgi:hypothetical protein